jgi:hypothetical protein
MLTVRLFRNRIHNAVIALATGLLLGCGGDGSDNGQDHGASADAGSDASAQDLVCGAENCEPLAEYCSALVGGPAGSPTTYECAELPPECIGGGVPTCACFANDLGCDCDSGPEGMTVTCAAP